MTDETMDFGDALRALWGGWRVARLGWNGRDMWLGLQRPDEHSKMRQPYIYMSPVGGALVPWLASQSDMLAEDWVLVSNTDEPSSRERTPPGLLSEVFPTPKPTAAPSPFARRAHPADALVKRAAA